MLTPFITLRKDEAVVLLSSIPSLPSPAPLCSLVTSSFPSSSSWGFSGFCLYSSSDLFLLCTLSLLALPVLSFVQTLYGLPSYGGVRYVSAFFPFSLYIFLRSSLMSPRLFCYPAPSTSPRCSSGSLLSPRWRFSHLFLCFSY